MRKKDKFIAVSRVFKNANMTNVSTKFITKQLMFSDLYTCRWEARWTSDSTD